MSAFSVGGSRLEILQGDIVVQQVDAIVNAANASLAGGGGVDGAIHRAGGPEIMRACRVVGGCPTGSAVATTAGELRARHVIHAVGPVWRGGSSGEDRQLSGAYRASLERARELGDRSVAFPSISTGAYGYPVAAAARVALETVRAFLLQPDASIDLVRFVLFSEADLGVYESAWRAIMDEPPRS